MTKEQDIILKLMRKALHPDAAIAIPPGLTSTGLSTSDWASVINFATQQGVLGLCFEALEALKKPVSDGFKVSEVSGGFPDMDNLMDWLGQVEYQKTEYEHRMEVAAEFAAELAKVGVRTSVLKGMAFAQYYRHPELRYSCDFDCYLTDFEMGNRVAERMGGSVDRAEHKHSHIQLRGVHIENHLECTGIRAEGLEEHLTRLLFLPNAERIPNQSNYSNHSNHSNRSNLELPPLSFNALFCMYHAQTHFVVEDGIQLRHVVDWILIRRELKKAQLYEACVRDCKEYGMQKFMDALNGIADMVIGKRSVADLTKAERLLWEDMMHPEHVEKVADGWLFARVRVLHQIVHNGWKYRLYTDQTAWGEVCRMLRKYMKRVINEPMVLKYIVKKQ